MGTAMLRQEWLGIPDVAAMTGRSYNQVARLVAIGELHSQRVGWRWLVSRASAEAYLARVVAAGPTGRTPGGKAT